MPPELEAIQLAKEFDGREVIRSINLAVARGQLLAIVGGSGSGKTVLLHMLAGLLAPTRGTVLVADHSHPEVPLVNLHAAGESLRDQIRLHWAVVFQRNALLSGSVYDNVALLLREHTTLSEPEIDARVRESLAAAALDVDSVLYKDRDELSGGMAKRVAIARAIAIRPKVIFYDEPTTGLDPVVAGLIHDLLWKTHAGNARTSLIVTHDRDLLRRLRPRVVMLHEGRLAFDGEYDAFTTAPGPPAEYLRAMPVLHATPMS
jgi:phospholipid/cholesterol/gamma-HCH transport system ATP-binding protein